MRVSLIGGAGCGKSVTAAKLFTELKIKGHNIEHCQEFIKSWAYLKRVPKSFEQLYIFGKQVHKEDLLLSNGVEHLITDSAIVMQSFYARKYGFDCWQELLNISKSFDNKFQSLNIFLDREGIPYKTIGRYETEQEALNNDEEMKDFLTNHVGNFFIMKSNNFEAIKTLVEGYL